MAVDHKQPDMEFYTLDSAALASNQTDLSSPQQSWMSSQSADHQLMLPVVSLPVVLVESTAKLPMLVVHWVWPSAKQPMQSA